MQPHTNAKHRILRRYLGAWFSIIGKARTMSRASRALYVDGFAGPGRYKGGEIGSPIVAIEAARGAVATSQIPLRLVFIEKDAARHHHLNESLKPYQGDPASSNLLEIRPPIANDCETELTAILDKYDQLKKPFGPALVFLDQFGYSDVSLDLIGRLMKHRSCEVFTYLHAGGMIRFLEDPDKDAALTKAYGGDRWKKAQVAPNAQRAAMLASIYQEQLEQQAGVEYVWSFAMHGDGNQILYWLFFCTNNLRGLEEMKNAMLKVDDSGSFRFSDAESPDQVQLFSAVDHEWVAGRLRKHFAGKNVKIADVQHYVLTRTPAVSFRRALGILEKGGHVAVTGPEVPRKKGTFSDEIPWTLRFAPLGTEALRF